MPIADIARFNRDIIEATADLVCCYKPNLGFYEALGDTGWETLRLTLASIPPDVPVILDAKRGDIGNTSAAYAKAIFDVLGADAVTVNAWGGLEGIEPFLEHKDKTSFIWCRSSNSSASDFQDRETEFAGAMRPMWQVIALRAQEWNHADNVGIVIGATYPAQLAEARALCPEMLILVPGIGAQDGSIQEAVQAGIDAENAGIIVNASRGVLYADRGKDFALGARVAAQRLRDGINRHRRKAAVRIEG